jgi:hypothetical protein
MPHDALLHPYINQHNKGVHDDTAWKVAEGGRRVVLIDASAAAKKRFLVLHDYGMGALWWWIHARSAREILEKFAEVEVVDDREAIERAEGWDDLAEVDIDAATMPPGLAEARAERDAQRGLPGFGALADRRVLYLRLPWDGEDAADPSIFLMEVGPDGRRTRQVELTEDGTVIKSDPDDWPLNPPVVDLFDPRLVDQEISRDEFEEAWLRGRRENPP